MAEIQKFKREDIQLHYTAQGEGEPVVLLPGSISDMRTWTNQIEVFGRDYQVIAVSRRFQHPSVYKDGGDSSIEANTEDIIALIEHLGLKKVRLIGHSYGGYIALNLACKYPQHVKKLVLEEPVYIPALMRNPNNPLNMMHAMIKNHKAASSFIHFGLKGVRPALKALADRDLETAKMRFIQGLLGDTKTYEQLDELTKAQLHDNMATFAGEDVVKHELPLSETEKISCPTLLVNGDQSLFFFNYINQQLARHIKGAIQVTISDSNHWVHIDRKLAFNDMILNFLKD